MEFYYKLASYHRKKLDLLQEKYKSLYTGVVLDIGGRDRGRFKKPKKRVQNWIFADINRDFNPDIILDVTNMPQVETNSIDVINAIELFEHVISIEKGLNECFRVLKKNGILILSTPFMYQIHEDPFDFQRWTHEKWIYELKRVGFRIEKFIIMGRYFTSLAEMIKNLIDSLKKPYRRILLLSLPLLDKMVKLDNKNFVKNSKVLNNYHSGYFIIAKK